MEGYMISGSYYYPQLGKISVRITAEDNIKGKLAVRFLRDRGSERITVRNLKTSEKRVLLAPEFAY